MLKLSRLVYSSNMNASKNKSAPSLLFDGEHFGRRQVNNGRASYPYGGGVVASDSPKAYRVEARDADNLAAAVLFSAHLLIDRMPSRGPDTVEVAVAGTKSRPIVVTTQDFFQVKPEQLGALDITAINHTFGIRDLSEVGIRGEGNWDPDNHWVLSIGAAAWRAYENAMASTDGPRTTEY